ncbi:PAAR domain-containing protein [Pseudomonas syringae pv. philadelphi]|nr:PAAR domain-containing protein [Pseudomonas syringae pv. philadelphi]RMM22288.1 PAAR domain-containing protein [Pseudomonas syringae pv. berberidis]RMQ32263.1 PAAR domain-containing protein [Pseudomonas syringae pv. berberidis]
MGAANGAAAMAIWTERVGQYKDWDRKPKIHKKFGWYYHKQGEYGYFYDIWSNIYYGYVGRAGGLSESVLADGAGLEQIVSDTVEAICDITKPQESRKHRGPQRAENVEGLRAWDDVPDRISISIGVKLFYENPNGGVTARMIMDKVLAVTPSEWGDGASVNVCERY